MFPDEVSDESLFSFNRHCEVLLNAVCALTRNYEDPSRETVCEKKYLLAADCMLPSRLLPDQSNRYRLYRPVAWPCCSLL